jgi:nickel/cobalt exporter
MSIIGALVLGLGLGLRHATDADHIVVLSGLVQRERGVASVARVAAAWGLGHSVTFFGVGLAIVVFGLSLPAAFEPFAESVVAAMLIGIGAWHLLRTHPRVDMTGSPLSTARPMAVGLVHGLAGSAPIALMALATMPTRAVAVTYLVLFALGTIVGMVLFTMVITRPLAWLRRGERFDSVMRMGAGALSVLLGVVMAIERFRDR